MPDRRYRVLAVGSHPATIAAPVYRSMARHPRIELLVAYCNLHGAETGYDPELGLAVKWDVPVLEGYPWVQLPNWAPRPGLGRFLGALNPGIWKLISKGNYDAVCIHMGYIYASFWIALLASKFCGIPSMFGTDSTTLEVMDGSRWKRRMKPFIVPKIFALADISTAASEATKQHLASLGIPRERIFVMPVAVDNDWWLARSAEVNRDAVRDRWQIPRKDRVVLFCAKLQPWKRPLDLLRAFEQACVPGLHLVFAGDGPLRPELAEEVARNSLSNRVKFLGFVNQSELPGIYTAADLLVLPSQYDACPAVICEAMLCGTPTVISDEIRGRFDIVRHQETGFIFPCGNVGDLAKVLRMAFADTLRLGRMRDAARKIMETCSPAQNVAGVIAALDHLRGEAGL